MLKNTRYNLGRKARDKNYNNNTDNQNNPSGGSTGDLPDWEEKKHSMFDIPTFNKPSDGRGHEKSTGTVLNTNDIAGRFQCTIGKWKKVEEEECYKIT